MATIAELMVEVGADIKRLERGLGKAQRQIQDVGRSMERVGSRLTATLTAPLAAVGGIALKSSADFEKLRQSMNILNGSVEEGARNFERLKRFSAETPFQLNDLAKAQNMLQGFGMSADDAFQSLSMIGDIAAVTGGSIEGIGIAFGQAAAEGRLMTRDIRQLINQGVPAIKLLADTMGVAQSDVLDLASQGEISFEILQKSFRQATTEGGIFANGMQKQSQTLSGVFSTMKDNINIALASIGDTMSNLAKGIMQRVTDMAKAFTQLDESTKQMITTAGLLVAAIGPAIFIIGKLTVVIGALVSPIGLAVAAIAGLIVIGKNMYDNWEVIAAELNHLWQGIKKVAWQVVGGIMDAFTWMSTGLLNTLSNMASVVDQNLANALTLASAKVQEANKGIQESVEESKQRFKEAGYAAVEARKDMVSLGDSFWSIMDAIEGGIGTGLSWLSDTIFPDVREEAEKTGIAMNRMLGKTGSEDDISTKLTRATGAAGSIREAMGDLNTTMAATTEIGSLIGERLGDAFAQAALHAQNLGDAIKNVGKQLLGRGIANFFSLALGGGLGGLFGGGLFSGLGKIFGLAQGGLAFGPTLAVVGDNRGARSNPEVIAPLSKLESMMGGRGPVEVRGVIKGSDIHLSNERGKNLFR